MPIKVILNSAEEVAKFLQENGLDKSECKTHFVKGGYELWYPYIGDDGKAHLGRVLCKKETAK